MPNTKRIWIAYFVLGPVFWINGLILCAQKEIDEAALFYYNPMRIAMDPIGVLSKWLSSNGMAAITILFVVCLLLSKKLKSLDAPLIVYFYSICSFGLSVIAGDLLKEVLARPRPADTYGSEILAWSHALSYPIPPGHATKSIALVLPFILPASHLKKSSQGDQNRDRIDRSLRLFQSDRSRRSLCKRCAGRDRDGFDWVATFYDGCQHAFTQNETGTTTKAIPYIGRSVDFLDLGIYGHGQGDRIVSTQKDSFSSLPKDAKWKKFLATTSICVPCLANGGCPCNKTVS